MDTDQVSLDTNLNQTAKSDRTFLETICLTMCLEEATDKLELLRHVYVELDRGEEFGSESVRDNLRNKTRLEAIRKEVQVLLAELRSEMLVKGTTESLRSFVVSKMIILDREQRTIQKEKELRNEIKSLKEKLAKLFDECRNEEQTLDDKIVTLKIKIQEIKREYENEVSTATERSRVCEEDTRLRCRRNEETLVNYIECLKNELAEENDSHEKQKQFLTRCLDELEKKSNESKTKHEEEVKETEFQNDQLKAKIENLRIHETKLKELFQVKSVALEEEHKVLHEELERERIETEEKSAKKIQSWWRKIMIVHQLGIYRKHRKKTLKKKTTKTKLK